jgi:hypothetical protein
MLSNLTSHEGRVIALGYAFGSADYQLLPPATAEDIVKDIQDVFSFLVTWSRSISRMHMALSKFIRTQWRSLVRALEGCAHI